MSLYTNAVSSSGYSVGDSVDVGWGGFRKIGRLAKKAGKTIGKGALIASTGPVGIAYMANKARKKRKKAAQPQVQESSEELPADDEDEQNASEDDSDAESGDSTMSDEIGWDEIGDDVDQMLAGDDVGDETVGAALVRRQAGRPVPRGPNTRTVNQRGYSKAREYPLGFSSNGTVAAGATVVITAQPQTMFRPKRLVIPSSVAPSFSIQDIKIGNQSQLVASGAIPGALYSELAVGASQRYDTANPGILISLTVTNNSAGPLLFNAAMVGDSIQ